MRLIVLPRRLQFLGFVAAGGLATMLNYGIFLFLMSIDVRYLTAAIVGYASGIVVSFSLNRLVIYRSTQPLRPQFVRYMGVYLIALAVQLIFLETLVRYGLGPAGGNAVAIVVVVVLNRPGFSSYCFPCVAVANTGSCSA